MAVLVLVCALATTTCVGYYVGRRAGSAPSTWRKRTSRVAIGRLAMSFVMVVAARRIRRTLRSIEPLELLRDGVAVVLRRASLV
ncbi:hypothetical protein [Mycobacterium florentinum]|uniref:hypothetical protein n=1 Tax=Mycobacterium florentinum TaxID=292462 RepID=UPI000A150856|nr:hypothetical protein [Mycobacterium florentinum]MCV7413509.1 hypothetical protein [Mycobacterium florentinum]